jgi:hypothetical protein
MDEEALYGSLVIRLMVFRRKSDRIYRKMVTIYRVNGRTKTEAQSLIFVSS